MTTQYRKVMHLCAVSAISLAAVPAAYAAESQSFNIPAQPLSSAIVQLSEQSDITILVSDDLVRGLSARAIAGRMTTEKALRELLRGTALKVQKGSGGTLTIVPAGNAGGGDGAPPAVAARALAGSVIDANTGAALKGAFVELVETGQTTSTDDLGRYRFAGLSGTHRVRVSYLGFPAIERDVDFASGLPVSTIVLAKQVDGDEILVIAGQISARAQALNQERTAENSTTIISSDLLGQFNGTTISDALRRAPGVAFQQNDVTGEGANVIVRGLAPDYNQVRLNGVPLASRDGRNANLSNILADSVSEVRISKTLLPNQDSSGAGGLVEILTKTPLDRDNLYMSAGVEGVLRSKGFGKDFLATGTVSARFGAEKNFGLSASVQYRDQDVRDFDYQVPGYILGPYLPLLSNGQPANLGNIDPRIPFPFENGANTLYPQGIEQAYRETHIKTLGLDLAAEWQVSPGTNWKLNFVRSDIDTSQFSRSEKFFGFLTYARKPIPALGGATRFAVIDTFANFGFPLEAQRYGQFRLGSNAPNKTDTFTFRGETETGKWHFAYTLGMSRGRGGSGDQYSGEYTAQPFALDATTLLPEATDPTLGYVVTPFGGRDGNGFPFLLMTPLGYSKLADPSALQFTQGIIRSGPAVSRNSNKNATLSARYDFAGNNLKYLELGVDLKRFSTRSRESANNFYYTDIGYPNASLLGLDFQTVTYSPVGGSQALPVLTEASLRDLTTRLDALVANGTLQFATVDPGFANGLTYTKEDDLAAYVQGRVDFGKLEVIGGVRATKVNVDAAFSNSVTVRNADGTFDTMIADASRRVVTGKASQTTFLPRVLANFRFNENMLVRAGYYSTVTRPDPRQQAGSRGYNLDLRPFFGPNQNQPILDIAQGNPDLKPARSHNFDASFELYDGNVGVIKISGFYKVIDNLLESNAIAGSSGLDGIELPDYPVFNPLPSNLFVQVVTPTNNPDSAKIWGFEAVVERRLTFLPGALGGLGVYLNYTYADSSKSVPRSWNSKPIFNAAGNLTGTTQENYFLYNQPFNQSPKHSGTAGLTYSRYELDASLYYSYQARRRATVADFRMHSYVEAYDSLDFQAQYRFTLAGADMRLNLAANNLLRGRSDPNVQRSVGGTNGMPKYYSGGFFNGGRNFTLGLSSSF